MIRPFENSPSADGVSGADTDFVFDPDSHLSLTAIRLTNFPRILPPSSRPKGAFEPETSVCGVVEKGSSSRSLPIIKDVRTALATDPLRMETVRELLTVT